MDIKNWKLEITTRLASLVEAGNGYKILGYKLTF